MQAKLSDHATYKTIFKLTIMPILMNIFVSFYTIVDGLCISLFDSSDAFAGVNLIFPIVMIIGGIGFMFGAGGSALSSKLLGEGNQEKANQVFTFLVIMTTIIGTIICIITALFIEPIAKAMASVTTDSTEEMVDEAIKYGQILVLGQTFFMLQSLFQSYFLVAEKGNLGFYFSLGSGLINIVFDLLFIAVLKMGVIGAALATLLGQIFGAVGPLIYFALHRNGRIWFGRIRFKLKVLLRVAFNGSSEFVNNVSSSIVGIVFNIQVLKYYGQNGISAYGALSYISLLFILIFVGFSSGVGPSISYHYGAKNNKELSTIFKRCSFVIILLSICMLIISEVFAYPLAALFSSGNSEIANITVTAIRIFSISYLLSGFGIFSSGFFTALNNGVISAIISFFRCLVFQLIFVFIFPLIIGRTGIWVSMIASELGSFILSIVFLIMNRNKYNYFLKVDLFER